MDLLFAELKKKTNEKKRSEHAHYSSLKNGLYVLHYKNILNKRQCSVWFDILSKIEFPSSPKIRIHGKWIHIPRQQIAYGDTSYDYSGITVQPKPWTKQLLLLKTLVENLSCHKYNFLLINKYRDGNDHISPHKDVDTYLDPTASIASISFGDTRMFTLQHDKKEVEKIKLMLCDGDIVLIRPPTNKHWKHSIVKNKSKNVRFNLTFRCIMK